MDGDLSLSQSFGGLKIANPDDHQDSPSPSPASTDSQDAPAPEHASPSEAGLSSSHPSTDTLHGRHLFSAAGAPATTAPDEADSEALNPSTDSKSSRLSILNVLRRADSSGSGKQTSADSSAARHPEAAHSSTAPEPPPQDPQPPTADQGARAPAAPAKSYRQSMPLSHQAQQQQLLASYQPLLSQNGASRYPPPPPSSRPTSAVYAAQPPPSVQQDWQQGGYRLRTESSMASMNGVPSRSDSRSRSAAMPAGVPTREPSHRDRSYTHNKPTPNGPLPPRRSSRAAGGGSHVNTPTGGMSAQSSYGSDSNMIPSSSEEWKDRGAAVAVRQEIDANGVPVTRSIKKGVRDFAFGRILGEGSYSTVLAATDRQTLKEYAVKILDKRHIIKEKKIKYVNIEKNTLNRLTDHPGIVRLYYTFQDEKSLYYVLDLASGGELLGVLKKIGTFDEECTRFYGAQILDSIEYMHSRGVIHRDLKPENVLLDDQMHVKITDFGTAKLLKDPRVSSRSADQSQGASEAGDDEEDSRATSFVGTAEYVSPELLTDKSACKASDLWAFGCIVYQLLSGRPPFKAGNEYQTFQKIVGLDYEFPSGFPPQAKDLIERLLVLDPQRRLSIEHIKNHEFFAGIRWGRGLWKAKAPRLKPYSPPAQEPNLIQLNGYSGTSQMYPSSRGSQAPPSNPSSNGTARPQPRVITELPPPTQLDIEWSPVLTRNNERILKLGNLQVMSVPLPHSPRSGEHTEGHKKLSRFFVGTTTKKRARLVMVTSSARIIMAAAGGGEKKTKSEISLLAPDCSWREHVDVKGQTVWCVDTRTTHYTFEDPKAAPETSKLNVQEWLDSIERAKDLAISQSMVGSYSSDPGFDDVPSSVSSPSTSTLGTGSIYPEGFSVADRSGRNHLTKSQASLDDMGGASRRHRFSKRASKNGLGGAVF